jgi:hypothetical protein
MALRDHASSIVESVLELSAVISRIVRSRLLGEGILPSSQHLPPLSPMSQYTLAAIATEHK